MNKLKQIAKDNKEIYKNGFYINSNGNKINIKEDSDNAIKNTSYYRDNAINHKVVNTNKFIVRNNIVKLGTIDCILKLRAEGEKGNIVALNFASATTPGGGYLNGSTAQEESICRASLLYPCLIADMRMYKENKENYNPLYSDRCKYSHNVPIIRDDNGELLENYELASFITSPAVNRKVAKMLLTPNDKINEVMDIRIRKIISLALEKNASVIVLGAFGCGVFGNNREVVYDLFENAINDLVPLESVRVIFAVRDNVSRK